jgi:hypothetical protein
MLASSEARITTGRSDHKPYGSVISFWTVRPEKVRMLLAYAKLTDVN